MDITSLTIAAVFGFAIALSWPLGWLFKVELKPGRFPHLDGLRAIAALMVVCSHYLAHSALIMQSASDARLIEALGAVGVQIFFCITGFLFTRKALKGPVDIAELISSRIRRIVPLYAVVMTAAITAAAYIATSANKAAVLETMDILRAYAYGFFVAPVPTVAGMSIGGQAGQMWTLAWEWRFYLMVPFIGALVARRAWGIAAVAFAVGCMFIDHPLYDAMPPWTFFIPGIVCALLEGRVKANRGVQWALSVVGFAAFLAALSFDMPVNGVVQTLLCTVGFGSLFFGHRALLSVRPLRLLGEVSYSIYMLHLLVATAFWVYVQDGKRFMLYQTSGEKLPIALMTLAGLFVLSFVIYALIERPFMTSHRESEPTGLKPEASA